MLRWCYPVSENSLNSGNLAGREMSQMLISNLPGRFCNPNPNPNPTWNPNPTANRSTPNPRRNPNPNLNPNLTLTITLHLLLCVTLRVLPYLTPSIFNTKVNKIIHGVL